MQHSLSEVEFKSFDSILNIKTTGEGFFSGYASVFDIVDSQDDIVLRGAFMESLEDDIKLLWQHDPKQPIGKFLKIYEDEKGLFVEGQILLDIEKGREAWSLLKNGTIEGLSIGFIPIQYSYAPATNIRMISKVKLVEISLVTFPANAQAKISFVKNKNHEDEKKWREFVQSGAAIDFMDALAKAEMALLS